MREIVQAKHNNVICIHKEYARATIDNATPFQLIAQHLNLDPCIAKLAKEEFMQYVGN